MTLRTENIVSTLCRREKLGKRTGAVNYLPLLVSDVERLHYPLRPGQLASLRAIHDGLPRGVSLRDIMLILGAIQGLGDLPVQDFLFALMNDAIRHYASTALLPPEPLMPDEDGDIPLPFGTLHAAITNHALTPASTSLLSPSHIGSHLGVICQIAESRLFVLILASSGLWLRRRWEDHIEPIHTNMGHALQIACTDTFGLILFERDVVMIRVTTFSTTAVLLRTETPLLMLCEGDITLFWMPDGRLKLIIRRE